MITVDLVRKTFDEWAINGRAELMEKEHGKNVASFLDKMSFDEPFSFLDIGCGNGWVVRKISSNPNCKKSVGIDKSQKMIIQARKFKQNSKERYIHTDIESWKYSGKFDFVFSMESLYYVDSIEKALTKIFKILKPGGEFFCGTDFYTDNNVPNSRFHFFLLFKSLTCFVLVSKPAFAKNFLHSFLECKCI